MEKLFYAIYEDLTYKEFDSLENAQKSGSIYNVEFFDKKVNTDSKDKTHTYWKLQTFDSKTSARLKIGKCSAAETEFEENWNYRDLKPNTPYDLIEAKIADAKGEIRKMEFGKGINGVIGILKLLTELNTKGEEWQKYDLIKDNERLSEKISRLESSLKDCKQRLFQAEFAFYSLKYFLGFDSSNNFSKIELTGENSDLQSLLETLLFECFEFKPELKTRKFLFLHTFKDYFLKEELIQLIESLNISNIQKEKAKSIIQNTGNWLK